MRHLHRLWLQQCVANWNYACNMSWRSKWREDTSTSSSSKSTCGLKCVRPQTATILTRRKWKLLPFPFCATLPWQCGAVAQGCGCGFGFRFGFWICYCCWLRGEQQLHKIYIRCFYRAIGKLIGRAASQLLGKICSYNAASWASELQQQCALQWEGDGAKNADHLFWPAMNLIDNFSWPSYPTISPILHLSGWENIWIYACAWAGPTDGAEALKMHLKLP